MARKPIVIFWIFAYLGGRDKLAGQGGQNMSDQGVTMQETGTDPVIRTATALCLTLRDKGLEVEYNGVRVDLLSAGRSRDLTDALLVIGLTSLHLGAPKILDTLDLPACSHTLTMLLDYAIDTCAELENAPRVLDGAAILERAREMRARFLDPAPDPDLVRTVGVISQMAIDGLLDLTTPSPSLDGGAREQ